MVNEQERRVRTSSFKLNYTQEFLSKLETVYYEH